MVGEAVPGGRVVVPTNQSPLLVCPPPDSGARRCKSVPLGPPKEESRANEP